MKFFFSKAIWTWNITKALMAIVVDIWRECMAEVCDNPEAVLYGLTGHLVPGLAQQIDGIQQWNFLDNVLGKGFTLNFMFQSLRKLRKMFVIVKVFNVKIVAIVKEFSTFYLISILNSALVRYNEGVRCSGGCYSASQLCYSLL